MWRDFDDACINIVFAIACLVVLIFAIVLLDGCATVGTSRAKPDPQGSACNAPPESLYAAESMDSCDLVEGGSYCCGYASEVGGNYCVYALCRTSCDSDWLIAYGVCVNKAALDAAQKKKAESESEDESGVELL